MDQVSFVCPLCQYYGWVGTRWGTNSWGKLSLTGSRGVSSEGDGIERDDESAGVSSGVGDSSCISNVEPCAGLWGRGEEGMMSIESLLGPGEEDGRGGVLKSPIFSRLAFGRPQWRACFNVTSTTKSSMKSRCEQASAGGLNVRTVKVISAIPGNHPHISSHLRPKPKFWPKSAAKLAVGEDPLIGITLK